ncbi:hypothetical protein N9R95_02020 [Flavobacteriaceae bacterium]|nr:hypothetical protein [Flavobacteriaceae bacterium]
MKNYLNKGMLALAGLCIIYSCSKDEDEPEIPIISNVSFTTVASEAGNVITVTPTSTDGTSYSIDFGSSADDDVLTSAGPGVSYTYPESDATYTIVVTASALGFQNANATQELSVDYTEPDPHPLEGRWVISHQEAALGVGPSKTDFSWYFNKLGDVVTRDCLFDDVYVFNADGSFQNIPGDQTWIEPGFGNDPEGCAATIAPWDGSIDSATWAHDEEASTITISGAGAYLGLFKIGNSLEYTTGATADESITYTDIIISEDKNTLTVMKIIADGTVFWRFILAKEGSTGAELPQTDTDGDGLIDALDACPTVAGTGDGCPVVTAPEDAPATPTAEASSVTSIFSDAYTDITSDFAPNWGQITVSTEETIADNAVKKLANFNFVGIDNVGGDAAGRVSIAAVTHVTFDYWTPNGSTLKFKLVDYGADGEWEQSTNVEQMVTVTEAATTETWTNVVLPISDFNTLSADGKIGQIVFDGGDGTQTFYIDNLYFY